MQCRGSSFRLLLLLIVLLWTREWGGEAATSSSSSSSSSFLLLCLADGSIYSVDAWSGQVVGVTHHEPLLQQQQQPHSTPIDSSSMIIPSLDGKLYWRPNDNTHNNNKNALQELPLTLHALLENPVRSCEPDQLDHCGILTAQAVTSLLALSDTGELLWTSSSNRPNPAEASQPHAKKSSLLLLQRKDYWIQHVHGGTGQQSWNVSLGTYQALDFGTTPSAADPGETTLLLDDDGVEDHTRNPGDSLPAVVFGDAGRTLTAVDSSAGTVLWSHHVPSTLSSVFGISRGNWETVQVLHQRPSYRVQRPLLLDDPVHTDHNNNKYNAEFFEEFLWNLSLQQQKEQSQQRRELPGSSFSPPPSVGTSTAECQIDSAGNLICPESPLRLPAPPVVHPSSGILISWEWVTSIVVCLLLGMMASVLLVRSQRRQQRALEFAVATATPQLKRSSSLPGNLNHPDPYNNKTALALAPPSTRSDDGVAPAQLLEQPSSLPLVRYSRYACEFEEVRKLGKGGFGSVYECKNVLDGRCYAVKKVSIHGSERDPSFQLQLQRVLREVKILAVLDHPNIVRYYTAWLEIEQEEEGDGAKNIRHEEDSANNVYSSSLLQSESVTQWDTSQAPLRRGSWSGRGNALGWNNNLDASDSSLFLRPKQPTLRSRPSLDNLMIFEDSNENAASKSEAISRDESISKEESLSATKYNSKNGPSQTSTTAKPSAEAAIRHTLYIQMQLCSQKTVAEFLSDVAARRGTASGSIDVPKALRLFLQIADAVRYVHDQKGLIHRDLKPSNCFMDDSGGNGMVKVGDFGLSRESSIEMEAPLVATNSSTSGEYNDDHTAGVGTRSYASPEQMKGSDYDSSTDVFSLGIMLFELLYPMYTGMERTICLTKLRDGTFPEDWETSERSSFPSLQDLIRRMVHSTPSSRPSAKEVTQHVTGILDEFTIVSLDHRNYNAAEVVLMRVEAQHRDDVLMRTMELIQQESTRAASPVDILQYGLRSGTVHDDAKQMTSIMEFALKYTTTSAASSQDAQQSASDLACKLMEKPEIFKARQVSTDVSSNNNSDR